MKSTVLLMVTLMALLIGARPVSAATAVIGSSSSVTELQVGNATQFVCTFTAGFAEVFQSAVWSGAEFRDPDASGCSAYVSGLTDLHTVTNGNVTTSTVTVLATTPGSVSVKCTINYGIVGSTGTTPASIDALPYTFKVLPKDPKMDRMPLGAKLRRVDAHGVPMPDPSPTGEGEGDRIPNMAYTDMFDLSPKYAATDVSVPTEGGELALEFRRTMSVRSRYINPDLTKLNITYPTEDLMGFGWDCNLGSRILLTTDADLGGNYYVVARVVDDVGNSTTYKDVSPVGQPHTVFVPDVTHSFNNESAKSTLTWDAVNSLLVYTKPHGTVVRFEHVRLFTAPYSVESGCTTPALQHTEDYWRLKSVTDRNGNQLTYTYYATTDGPNGDLVTKTITFVDAVVGSGTHLNNQRTITFTASHVVAYDENTSLGIPTGRDSGWRLSAVVDPLGRTTSFTYTSPAAAAPFIGVMTTVTRPAVENPAGGANISPVVTFAYGTQQLPDAIIDPAHPPANQTFFNWFLAPTRITDARGLETNFTYLNELFPTASYASLSGSVWQYRLRLASMSTTTGGGVTAVDGTATFATTSRSATQVITTATDTRGVVTTYNFLSSSVTAANTSIGGSIEVYQLTRSTAGITNPVIFEWGHPTNPADPSTATLPDQTGDLVKVTDFSGNQIRFEYRSNAGDNYDKGIVNPALAVDPITNPSHYQAFCQPARRVVDPTGLNLDTEYRYETVFNKELSTTDAEGKQTTYTIDAKGNRTAVNEAVGTAVAKVTNYVYDAAGFITQITNVESPTTNNRVTNVARDFNNTTLSAYQTTTTTVVGFTGTPLNLVTITIADVVGNQVQITDPRTNITTAIFDGLNRKTSVTKPAVINSVGVLTASTSETHYDLNGNVIRTVDDEGNATTTTYDMMNRPTAVRRRMTSPTTDDNVNDLITSTNYSISGASTNSIGLPRITTDAMNNQTVFAYDNLMRLTLKTFPLVTLPGGGTTNYTEQYLYDGGNAGSGAFTHWSGWQPTRVIDKRGFFTDTKYDKIYRPIQVVRRKDATVTSVNSGSAALAGEPATTTTYNKNHKVISVTTLNENFAGTAANQIVYTSYDSLYRPTVNLVDVDGAAPVPAQFVEDGIGFTTTSTTAIVTRTKYDLTGNALQVKDGEGNITITTYDGANRATQVQQPSVNLFDPANFNTGTTVTPTTKYTYDANGNKTLIEDANHSKTQITYDARNRSTQSVLDLNNDGTYSNAFNGADIVSLTRYNLVDKVVLATDSRGNATATAYDRAYRVLTVTQPQVADAENAGTLTAPVITTTYDKNSNVLTMQDGRQLAHAATVKTVNSYDELNRLRTSTQAATSTEAVQTESQYDANNNVTSLILHNSAGSGGDQTTTYAFDAFNRRTTETLPKPDASDRITTTTYYRNGTVRTVSDPKVQVKESEYDRANRILILRSKLTGGTLEETRTFTYNRVSKPKVVADKNGSSTYTYDAIYRPLTEARVVTGQTTYTVTSSYDALGQRTKVKYPVTNRTITNTMDRANRLKTVTDGTKLTQYTFDANSNRLTVTDPNGEVQTNIYNAMNWATSSVTAKAGTTVSSYVYAFDLVGNRRTLTEILLGQTTRTVTYGYDNQYRLTSEAWTGFSSTFTYDLAGNRLTWHNVNGATTDSTYTYDTLNRLKTLVSGATTLTYTYDLNGNQTLEDNGAGTTTPMTWDTFNRMLTLTNGGATLTNTYDYRSRRLTKAQAGTTTFFRYDGGVSFHELISNVLKVEYMRGMDMGGGIGSILYSDRTMAGGVEETFAYNPSVGHVVATTNSTAGIVSTERYDAFGLQVTTTGTTSNNRLANTKERNVVGAFTTDYHGFRFYNPKTGRYLSRDPLGYKDGLNPYTYVHNNPINHIDPLGLFGLGGTIIGGIVGGAVGVAVEMWTNPNYNASSLTAAAIGGAVSGATFGSGFGAIEKLALPIGQFMATTASLGFWSGVAGSAAEQVTEELLGGEPVNLNPGKTLKAGLAGIVGGGLAGAGGKVVEKLSEKVAEGLEQAMGHVKNAAKSLTAEGADGAAANATNAGMSSVLGHAEAASARVGAAALTNETASDVAKDALDKSGGGTIDQTLGEGSQPLKPAEKPKSQQTMDEQSHEAGHLDYSRLTGHE